jgi:dynein heavy chain
MGRLESVLGFESLRSDFALAADEWRQVFDSPTPHEHPLLLKTSGNDKQMGHLFVLRALRPDKVIPAVRSVVEVVLGSKFVEPPPFDLARSFDDSSPVSPLLFVLSPGSDPTSELMKFAEEEGREVLAVSLGQGQGPRAEAAMEQAAATGNWVLLQNCHLAVSWLPRLESLVESLDVASVRPTFRLWLTSYPSAKFPVSILQNGVKMTNEPPAGIRANLFRSFTSDPIAAESFFNGCDDAGVIVRDTWRRLLFNLCFFHATIQERRGFGPLGWNIPYEFNTSDLRISLRQLQSFVISSTDPSSVDSALSTVPWAALRYLTGECNYGGRVTDDHDRRTLLAILEDFYSPEALQPDTKFSPSGLYVAPIPGVVDEYVSAISALPLSQETEVFGLHRNADIAKDQAATAGLFHTMLVAGGGGSGGPRGDDTELLAALTKDILGRLPDVFDIEAMSKKYPVEYSECFNTVLVQEAIRYNRLLRVVRDSMVRLVWR